MSSPTSRQLFVTLEGGEGSGKSTVGLRLQKLLVSEGHRVLFTREPGSTELGESVRRWLLSHSAKGAVSPEAETLLFLAARAQHLQEVIKPALAQGQIVLCDRFHDSTIAYQGHGRELGGKWVEELCIHSCEQTAPDLTLLLDVDPRVGLERATRHAPGDRLEAETLAFHERVRRGFLELAERYPQRIRLIDASQPLDDVVARAFQEIKWNPSSATPTSSRPSAD